MTIIENRTIKEESSSWQWPSSIPPLLRKIYSSREVNSPDDINYVLSNILPISHFKELDQAVDLLVKHKKNKILVVGDFDVDGATSTSLVLLCLKDFGFKDIDYFIPDRFKLGYGLSEELIHSLDPLSPDMIITVDNGITSIEGCKLAKEKNIDVLITDHHIPGEDLPDATLVNPNLNQCSFKGKNLAGVGVAFYLMAALGKFYNSHRTVLKYLDLVALGTVADLVKLDLTNRIFIKYGLDLMRSSKCLDGIKALANISNIKLEEINEADLSYRIAPKINAAGRMEDMAIGIKCLTSSSYSKANDLANRLEKINKRRKLVQGKMSIEADNMVNSIDILKASSLPNIISLYRDDWHEGVVGIVASKLKEKYYRPVFIFASAENDMIKGSGRSIPGFHLRDALAEIDTGNPELISKFGGHAMAAGLTIKQSNLESFNKEIRKICDKYLDEEILSHKLITDGQLDKSKFTLNSAKLILDGGPWGQNFPEPLFDNFFILVSQSIVGNTHLKMVLNPLGSSSKIDAIAFNKLPGSWQIGTKIRIIYKLKINNYFDLPRLQLIIIHIEE